MEILKKTNILVIGIFLSDRENLSLEITNNLKKSQDWNIEIIWAAIGNNEASDDISAYVKLHSKTPIPKFLLLNEIISKIDIEEYEYIIVTDDDISLADDSLNELLRLQEKYQFSLAQAARTHDSYTDHYFVNQLFGIEARETRFVEIGPLFSIHKSAYPILLPFIEDSPMGWGLDFVWPLLLEKNNLKMGIIDAVAVTHKLRKPASLYSHKESKGQEIELYKKYDHLLRHEAFTSVRSYPISKVIEKS